MLKLKIPDKEAIKQTNKTKTNKTNIAKKKSTLGNRGKQKSITF